MSGSQKRDSCRQGHPYEPDNTYVRPDGWRECVTCRRRKSQIRHARARNPRATEMRFFSRVTQVDDCWIYASPRPNWYGRFWYQQRNWQAHRWAYEFLVAEIPAGLQLDHLCRTPACVNPWHLEPVTGRVNTLRGLTLPAANAAKEACVHGHDFTEANTRINRDGSRTCRTCARISSRQKRDAA